MNDQVILALVIVGAAFMLRRRADTRSGGEGGASSAPPTGGASGGDTAPPSPSADAFRWFDAESSRVFFLVEGATRDERGATQRLSIDLYPAPDDLRELALNFWRAQSARVEGWDTSPVIPVLTVHSIGRAYWPAYVAPGRGGFLTLAAAAEDGAAGIRWSLSDPAASRDSDTVEGGIGNIYAPLTPDGLRYIKSPRTEHPPEHLFERLRFADGAVVRCVYNDAGNVQLGARSRNVHTDDGRQYSSPNPCVPYDPAHAVAQEGAGSGTSEVRHVG